MDDSFEQGKAALISGIESDARAEAEQIVAEAEKSCADLAENSRQHVASLLADAEKKAAAQSRAVSDKILAGVDLEIRRKRMQMEETLHREILDAVKERIRGMTATPQYRQILMQWVAEAAAGLDAQRAEINASAGERALIDKAFMAAASELARKSSGRETAFSLSDAPPLAGQGIILSAADGRIAFNNQVTTRIDRLRREIRKLIYEKLFAGGK
jgi:V/A-type H+-transporting ATPase subunit E